MEFACITLSCLPLGTQPMLIGHVALELVDVDCVRRNTLHKGAFWVGALLCEATLVTVVRSDVLTTKPH